MIEVNTPSPVSAEPVTSETDAFGRIEVRGIDYIPPAERHGKPRELFWVWAASNVTYLYVVLGGAMLMLGLSLWQALAVVVAGNLCWFAVGWLAVSGPAAGTPSVAVMRAMFGVRGNRIFGAGLGWLIAVSFEAINLVLGSLAAFALAEQLGLDPTTPVKVAILAIVAVVTFTISIYGHATIVRLSPIFAAALTICIVLLGYFVFDHAHFDYAPAEPLAGGDLWSVVLIGFALIAAAPLSWASSADYSRYLPASTSRSAVVLWTALGGLVPAVLLTAIGIAAATSIDMTDPQTALAEIVPGWFYPVFLLVIVVGSITNNVLTTYSSGLSLQGMGVKAKRSISVLIDGLIGGAIAVYMLFFAESFLDALSKALELSVVVLGPATAVYATDIVLRRNRYDGIELSDETSSSPHWYTGGFRIAGVAALVLGSASAFLAASSSAWQGPIAHTLGTDISVILGPVVAILIYVVLIRFETRTVGS